MESNVKRFFVQIMLLMKKDTQKLILSSTFYDTQ